MLRANLIAAVSAIIGLSTAAYADEVTYSYNVQSGNCKLVAQPPNNKPVHFMGSLIVPNGSDGAGEIVIQRSQIGNTATLRWAGVDLSGGVTRGLTDTPGQHIMYLDALGYVDVQYAASAKLQVCNTLPYTAAGYLTFIY